MGIDNVALKTFNSTGAQSVCRANEADSSKLIESQFLTKCTTEYINGSGMSVINGPELPGITNTTKYTFTLPNDSDAISDMLLQINMVFNNTQSRTITYSKTLALDLVRKIEIKMGNLTIQTLYQQDIYARNITEYGTCVKLVDPLYSQVSHTPFSAAGNDFISQAKDVPANEPVEIDGTFSIPFTGRDKLMNRCFLQAGAITNSLSVTVYFNDLGDLSTNKFQLLSSSHAITETYKATPSLVLVNHQITQTEKNFISKNIINRIVNTSQTVQNIHTPTTDATDQTIIVNLAGVNINVSHIIICLQHPLHDTNGTISTNTSTSILQTPSGFAASCQAAGSSTGVSVSSTPEFTQYDSVAQTNVTEQFTNIGFMRNWLKSVELTLGTDRTGNIPASVLLPNDLEIFGLVSSSNPGVYVLRLADKAFSTAGIPFSRVNNKQLKIVMKGAANASAYNDFTSIASGSALPIISVTACGTQVQTTVGGSTSFSA